MSVTYWKEISDDRDGTLATDQLGRSEIRYTRTFRAGTDDNDDDAYTIRTYSDCPKLSEVHPNDATAYVVKVYPYQTYGKRWWNVTVLYSSRKELSVSPLDDPVSITWHTESFQRPYFEDRDGEGILNSAGDPYVPAVEGDDQRWVATVTWNEAFVPTWVITYKNAVNDAEFTIDGLTVDAGDAKLMGIRISDWQQRNDVRYRVVQLSIAIDDDGWTKEPLDAGFNEIDPDETDGSIKRIVLEDGEYPAEPVLLDGSGERLDSPSAATASFGSHDIYPEKDFSVFPLNRVRAF